MAMTTWCLSEKNKVRLQKLAEKRRKEPGMQLRVTRTVYDRLMKHIPNRDKRRTFIDAALTAALDAAGA